MKAKLSLSMMYVTVISITTVQAADQENMPKKPWIASRQSTTLRHVQQRYGSSLGLCHLSNDVAHIATGAAFLHNYYNSKPWGNLAMPYTFRQLGMQIVNIGTIPATITGLACLHDITEWLINLIPVYQQMK